MDTIPSARMAYAPGLAWVYAMVVAGVVLIFGVLAVLAGVVGLLGFAASVVIATLFAIWGATLWRRNRRRQPGANTF